MTIKFESEIKYFPLLIPLWGGGRKTPGYIQIMRKKRKRKSGHSIEAGNSQNIT